MMRSVDAVDAALDAAGRDAHVVIESEQRSAILESGQHSAGDVDMVPRSLADDHLAPPATRRNEKRIKRAPRPRAWAGAVDELQQENEGRQACDGGARGDSTRTSIRRASRAASGGGDIR